jgi:hypothetical protein
VNPEGALSFAAGSARRFFPLLPISEEWFEDGIFSRAIPESAPHEAEPEAIVQFRRHIDKEFAFQSNVDCEGNVSADEASEVTADVPESQLWGSFIDQDSVSQGSWPTPPDIKAIPVAKVVETINDSMTAPLRAIRRRRVIVTSDDEEEVNPKSGTGVNRNAAGDE